MQQNMEGAIMLVGKRRQCQNINGEARHVLGMVDGEGGDSGNRRRRDLIEIRQKLRHQGRSNESALRG